MNLHPWNNNNFHSNSLNHNSSLYNHQFTSYVSNNPNKSQFIPHHFNSDFQTQTLQRSTTEPQTHTLITLQNDMAQLLQLIELEKQKLPPNINLIQFYVNLHAHKIQQFKRNITWLPQTINKHNSQHFQTKINEKQSLIQPPIIHNTHPIRSSFSHSLTSLSPKGKPSIRPIRSNSITSPFDSTNNHTPIKPSYASKASHLKIPRSEPFLATSTKQNISVDVKALKRSHSKEYIVNENKKFVIVKYDENKCLSVVQCQCIQNVIKALLFYQTYQNKEKQKYMTTNDIKQFFLNTYTHINLLNDYHHILQIHLDCDTESNNKQFELISEEFSEYIACDINICQPYQRNGRIRQENLSNINNGYFLSQCSETAVFTDFLDTIHCHFLHSFDTAYRIKRKDQMQHHMMDSQEKQENDCHDFAVENLKKFQDEKRQCIPSLPRIIHYKFCTSQFDNEEELDETNNIKSEDDASSNISFNDTASIVSIASVSSVASTANNDTNTYSFGNRFYYWNYYKDNNEKDPWNHGFIFSQWYIAKKFVDLKEELLHNFIHRLDIKNYKIALMKAETLIQTDVFKAKQCDTSFFVNKYGVDRYDCMNVKHLLSLTLYTDFHELGYQFSKTFRKKYPTENFASIKDRNSNYANWSRLLRESVECFGQKMKDTKIKIFYHGVSYMVLNSLVCRFCGPTSSTPQVEVASIFSKKKGIILELVKYSNNLRYFNCSLVSCYSNEDERLFVGGFHELNIRNVREIKRRLNYRKYIRALSIFDQAINGKRHIRFRNVTQKDYLIIKKLIKDQLKSDYSNNFPDYINSCFNEMVQTRKKIKINLHWLNRQYPGFVVIFLDDKIKNLVLFDVIGAIFYSCIHLTVNMDQFDAQRNITQEYLFHLAQVLKRLNNIAHSKLRKIKINGVRIGFHKYESLPDWKLEVKEKSGQASSNLLLTKLNGKMSKETSFGSEKHRRYLISTRAQNRKTKVIL